MAKYFFCNKFVNEMFLGCNIKNLFGSREASILYYASVCFRHRYCIQIIGSNIEYNPKFLGKIKKALEFQCLYRSFYFHWLKQS